MTDSKKGGGKPSKAVRDNRANQLNPNNDKYYQSRGQEGRPNKSSGKGTPATRRW